MVNQWSRISHLQMVAIIVRGGRHVGVEGDEEEGEGGGVVLQGEPPSP